MQKEEFNNPFLFEEYKSRINKVIDYIDNNIINNFTLEELASVANFSKFHFHRIFHSIMGEPLFRYILRIRVERAAILLLNNPKKTVTDITYECGFTSPSILSRNFKSHFGITPINWKKKHSIYNKNVTNSKESQLDSNQKKVDSNNSIYIYDENIIQQRGILESDSFKIEIKELPKICLAYVRYIGPYKGDSKLFQRLFEKLYNWGTPRNLINPSETKFISISHDSLNITDENKLRVSCCFTVPENTIVDGEIGIMKLQAGRYAVFDFRLEDDEYSIAWNWIYAKWLPNSGYIPDDRYAFEMYSLNDHEISSKKGIKVQICVPIIPL